MNYKSGIALTLLCFAFIGNSYAEKVRYMSDGDTFILMNNQRVRMIGINAPEIDHRKYGKKGQPFGNESKTYLKNLIQARDVTLKNGSEEFDRFGRRLAYVYLPDGTFVNREMVRLGYAETFRKFPFEYKQEFYALEDDARRNKLGMWSDRQPDWLQYWMDEAEKWLRRYFK